MAKTNKSKSVESYTDRRKKRGPSPVDLQLTMVVNFGDEPDESVTVVDDKELRMVGSALKYRDKAIRFTLFQLIKAGLSQPKVAKEIAPGVVSLLTLGKKGVSRVTGSEGKASK